MKNDAAGGKVDMQKAVHLLVEVGRSDSVYADLYRDRARELLGSILSPAQYEGLKRIDRDIDEALKQSKTATMLKDWQRVESLAARVDQLRGRAQDSVAILALGAAVYDTSSVSIDPFSPGFESLPGVTQDLPEIRDELVENLKTLATVDPSCAPLYAARQAFFSGLALVSKRATAATPTAPTAAEIEQLAAQAAQAGNMQDLRRYAQELLALQARQPQGQASAEYTKAPPEINLRREVYQPAVDLAAPFTEEVVQRARTLGLAAARTEPLPQIGPLLDYVATRIWQASLSDVDTERDGAMRVDAVIEGVGFPPEIAEPVKVLVGQFLLNPFVNSGGARYIPMENAETVLIEDFPEDQDAPVNELLTALGLQRRRAVARRDINEALLQHGPTILKQHLLLDPQEFRLVCLPYDLYQRCGRDRGWGKQPQWTHFDGYQVFKNGRVRALAGGDVRYGGLNDLVSIGMTDEREGVITRFAVIRRARQVVRWR